VTDDESEEFNLEQPVTWPRKIRQKVNAPVPIRLVRTWEHCTIPVVNMKYTETVQCLYVLTLMQWPVDILNLISF